MPLLISPPLNSPSQPSHTSGRRGSQQGEGQLRGDFNLSGKIHIKPLMPAFTILSLLSPVRSPPWHQSLLPSSSSSSSSARHLIQITELASVSLCLEPLLCLADGQERTRLARVEGCAGAHIQIGMCVFIKVPTGKGKAEGEEKSFVRGKLSNSDEVTRLQCVKRAREGQVSGCRVTRPR